MPEQVIPLPQRIIQDSQRLVPKDFTYGKSEIEKDVVAGVDFVDENGKRYNGYPQEGLHLTEREFDNRKKDGILLKHLLGVPGKRRQIPYFVDHGGRYIDGVLDKNAIDVQDLPTDKFPLHPFARAMLTKSKLGAITGPGYYWKPGPQATGDGVIIRLYSENTNEKAQLAVIKGGDRRGLATIGGDVDPGEDSYTTVVREAGEEAGLKDLDKRPHAFIRRDVVIGDWRATVNAWPQTDAHLFVIDDRGSDTVRSLVGGEEEIKAEWMDLTSENIATLSFHSAIARLGVLKLEEKWGIIIDKNANIGKTESINSLK